MADAYWINDWCETYECDKNGKPWKSGDPRTGELQHFRHAAWGFDLGERWQMLIIVAGAVRAMQVFGLYIKLVEIAARRKGGERGWVLSGSDEVVGPKSIAQKLRIDPDQIAESLDILINRLGWVSIKDCECAVEGDERVIKPNGK